MNNHFVTNSKYNIETNLVHGVRMENEATGAISVPIYQTATFEHLSLEPGANKYNYSRCINPTREELENTMALLEGGIKGFAVSSGMAAITLATSILKSGDHVLISDDIYGGTYRLCLELLKPNGIDFTNVDMSNLESVNNSIKANTKMIFAETPTNPMMKVVNIMALSKIAKKCNALLVVDNTFLTPFYQRPLMLGADIVVHSGTKYLAGHNDTLAGIVVVKSQEIADKLVLNNAIYGAALSPFDSWLTLRGIKTLGLRMRKHSENALLIANWLRTQSKVKNVYYIGFNDRLDYELSCKQTTGFGGMISFELADENQVKSFLSKIKLIKFAESLGGVESLITHPATRTHTEIPKEIREKSGITEGLLRLSVGIEEVNDIIKDLEKAICD